MPPVPERSDTGPAADRPLKRARWTCLLDDDDARRWVIEGSTAEAAHRAAGGRIYDATLGREVHADTGRASGEQEGPAQDIAADIVLADNRDSEGFRDFGFDDADGHDMFDDGFEFEGPHLDHGAVEEGFIVEHGGVEAFHGTIPELQPETPPGAEDELVSAHGAHSSAAAPSPTSAVDIPRSQADAEATAAVGGTSGGFKRRRLSAKTGPDRAAELGYPPPRMDVQSDGEEGEEGLVTQSAATAARARIRALLSTHKRKVRAARAEAWVAFARQPDLGFLGGEAAVADSDDVGRDRAAPAPVVPGCWDAHPSHEVAAPSPALLFCRHCGAWSAGHRVRGLAKQCRGAVGHRGNLRLLTLGIAPVKGARVPAECKRAGSRGTRGGKATKGARGRRRAA